jgi:hypothetical protein
VEALGAALAVETRDGFEVALGRFAAEFAGESGDVRFRKQWRLLRDGRAGYA